MRDLRLGSRNDDPATADVVAETRPPPFHGLVVRAAAWLEQHKLVRLVLAVAALSIALVPAIGLLLVPDVADRLGGFGLIGVFLANIAGTATLFIPVPGLTAAAQALIVDQGEEFNPLLVGVIGGAGMSVGEITAYYAGMMASQVMRGRELSGPRWFRRAAEWTADRINWLLRRGWGVVTLFVLAAVPNPLFEVAGITAGSVRMPFRMFFASVTAGKILRGIVLAYLGSTFGFPSL
jgi:membrane protein DedA with SNARE-associated domain